jgi:hypothetical protein
VGLTVIVNMLTVAHKGSSGMSISFPDVCKTPTPAGPVPIPYPNIAKSSDVTSGSSTVKMDGGMIMNKSSNMMMSTGDEAGSAMGVISSKIKGKAEFVNYSFDVKVDGKNVARLTDPSQTNMGGSANSMAPALIQAPLFAMGPHIEECAKIKAKEKNDAEKNKRGETDTGWHKSGVHPKHKGAFVKVAERHKVILFLRRGKEECLKWIGKGFMPKPHSLINGNTLTKPERFELFQKWLSKYWSREGTIQFQIESVKFRLRNPPIPKGRDYRSFEGIVIDNDTGAPCHGGFGRYMGKWVTGDYDLMDVVKHDDPSCLRVTEDVFKNLMHELNKEMGWPGIQHPPQAYWTSKPEEWKKGAEKFNLTGLLTVYLANVVLKKEPYMPRVIVATNPTRALDVLDTELTVIAPGKVAKLDGDESVAALICCGCYKTDKMKEDEFHEKKRPIPPGED